MLVLLAQALASTPDELVERALAAHPDVEARSALVSQLEHRASASGTWADPVLAAELSNLSTGAWTLDGHMMSGLQLKLSQQLPAPGLTSAREDAAAARVRVAEHAVDATRDELAGRVEQTWWTLVRVRSLAALTERHVALTDELLEAARARYEVGDAGQHALLRLEVQRGRLQQQLHDAARDDEVLLATLSAAVAEPVADIEPPPSLEPVGVLDVMERWGEDDLDTPRLAALAAQAQAAELDADLARATSRPAPTVWVGYRVRTAVGHEDAGEDLVSAGVAVPLPLGSSRRGAADEAAALDRATEARALRSAENDRLVAALEAELATLDRAAEKVASYDEALLPAAEAALATTLSDYRVGRADFSSLYQAWTTLLELERERVVAVVDTHLAASRARVLIGADR